MTDVDPRTESRLDELESRLAFQDDLIDSLNEIITRQDRDILRLQQKLKSLSDKINDLGESGAEPGSPQSYEVPPHY